MDSINKYFAFKKCTRPRGQTVQEFLAVWENCYAKVKAAGCEMSDQVLAYKLLTVMDLREMDCKLVLTGVDYAQGKTKKNLLTQMIASIKKFIGCTAIQDNELVVKVKDLVYMMRDDMEKCFVANGWKKPGGGGGGRTRTWSNSLPAREIKGGYMGK